MGRGCRTSVIGPRPLAGKMREMSFVKGPLRARNHGGNKTAWDHPSFYRDV